MKSTVLLWDNDGILVDTERLYFEASRDVLARAGFELSLERHRDLSLVQGRSVFDIAADAGVSAPGIDELRAERDARYSELLKGGVEAMPGVMSVLTRLKRSFRMAIVTSCRPEHFALIHQRGELLKLFEFALTPDQYDKHKPHPEPYLTAAQRLGVSPGQCVVIEDSERGVRAAVAAGMRCYAIPTDMTRGADFSLADGVLHHVTELVACVEGLE